jgi:hypothetical protein
MDFTVGEHQYHAERIPALQQFHIMRRLAPFIGQVVPVVGAIKGKGADAGMEAVKPLADALASMSDADANYVLFGLLRFAKRAVPGGLGAVAVVVGEQLNHQDITMLQMLQIAWQVLRVNMADFTAALPSDLLDKFKTSAP